MWNANATLIYSIQKVSFNYVHLASLIIWLFEWGDLRKKKTLQSIGISLSWDSAKVCIKEYCKDLFLDDAEQFESFTRILCNFWNFEWKFDWFGFPPVMVNADRAEPFWMINSFFSLAKAQRWANWYCIARNWIAYLSRSNVRLYLVSSMRLRPFQPFLSGWSLLAYWFRLNVELQLNSM